MGIQSSIKSGFGFASGGNVGVAAPGRGMVVAPFVEYFFEDLPTRLINAPPTIISSGNMSDKSI